MCTNKICLDLDFFNFLPRKIMTFYCLSITCKSESYVATVTVGIDLAWGGNKLDLISQFSHLYIKEKSHFLNYLKSSQSELFSNPVRCWRGCLDKQASSCHEIIVCITTLYFVVMEAVAVIFLILMWILTSLLPVIKFQSEGQVLACVMHSPSESLSDIDY